jgi:hypothetical protein
VTNRCPDKSWQSGDVITSNAFGPGWIAQRRDQDGTPGNFEVVVPERVGAEIGLGHYWFDNSRDGARRWHSGGWAAFGADGAGAVIENRTNGNLEAIALHGTRLVHHWFDQVAWRERSTITTRATGAATLFQSSFDDHLEVIVAEGGDLVL